MRKNSGKLIKKVRLEDFSIDSMVYIFFVGMELANASAHGLLILTDWDSLSATNLSKTTSLKLINLVVKFTFLHTQ
ncbi:hypothetical protein ACJX0J_022239, partial [Zea mays]